MPNNIVMLSMGREWQREIKYKCTNMGELSCVSGRGRTELIIHCFHELLAKQEDMPVRCYIVVHNAQEEEAFRNLKNRFIGKLCLISVKLQEGKNSENDYQNTIRLFDAINQNKAIYNDNMISMDISSEDYRLFMDVSALLYGIDMKKGLYITVDNKKRELSITDGSTNTAYLHYTVQKMQRYLNSDVIAECSQELFAQSPYIMALLDISKRLNDEIKHCCAYDKIKNTLMELGDYLKCHKSAADDTSSVPVVNEIEQRYIVRLQREYAPILNT